MIRQHSYPGTGGKVGAILLVLAHIMACGSALAQFEDPFSISTDIEENDSGIRLTVSFSVPDHLYLYEDKVTVKVAGTPLTPLARPETEQKKDPVTGDTISVYPTDVTFRYDLPMPGPRAVVVSYQGCDDRQCFLPQEREIALGAASAPTATTVSPQVSQPHADWCAPAAKFTIVRKSSGYLKSGDFLAFLKGETVDDGIASSSISQAFWDKGIGISIVLIILGGLALNLTPCVLPMIPINLAIIGVGAQGSTRRRGVVLGGTYGLGIATVYGALGLMVVLTGAKFGALNSSPWFNLAIALLFLLMSMAMFGVVTVDFSRFQGSTGDTHSQRGKLLTAFAMGGIAALLAGACVAPVVISVLLLSADLYSKGHVIALALPFILGLGMALPWPFAGAGLSFLPKPGKWMVKIKYAFGIVILAFCFWYGKQFMTLIAHRDAAGDLCRMLTAAQSRGQPVLIDFRASWCKNCLKMEKTTFKDPQVAREMEAFSTAFFDAENLNDEAVKTVLDYYGVIGLPTYVILEPINDEDKR